MIITKKFSYNGKFHCDALLFRGTAVGVNKSRTVHTETSGGGGRIRTGIDGKPYGDIDEIITTTETYIYDEFFLRNQTSGKEKDFSLVNWDIALRDGHDAVVAWVIPHGNNRGPYVAFHNYTLHKITWRPDLLPQMFQIEKPFSLQVINVMVWICSIYIPGYLLVKHLSIGFFLSVLCLIAAAFGAVKLNAYLYKLTCGARDEEIKAARKALNEHIVQMMNEAKP